MKLCQVLSSTNIEQTHNQSVDLSVYTLIFCSAIFIPQYSSPEKDEVGFEGFDEVNEVGDYEEYEDEYVTEGEEVEEDWVDYEYVDLQKDSDGDGLR